MARIVVFDSGLGSLSIIKPIQRTCKAEIIYFGDRKNFPYGKKSKKQLEKIIKNSINVLKERFNPDLIIIGSNTPTIMLDITSRNVIGVNPPLTEASKLSKTKNLGILTTESVVKSKSLSNYIKNCKLPKKIKVHKINGSNLVQLVETGKFIEDEIYCSKQIKISLEEIIIKNQIDVITLSSTHLPFLKKLLISEFPNIQFLDPAQNVANEIFTKLKDKQSKRNLLKIYSSDKTQSFQKNLLKLGIKNKIEFLSI
jgi:glutamate racemase